jgi:hypothetical protein
MYDKPIPNNITFGKLVEGTGWAQRMQFRKERVKNSNNSSMSLELN